MARKTTTSISIQQDLLDRIKEKADSRSFSVSVFIGFALESYLSLAEADGERSAVDSPEPFELTPQAVEDAFRSTIWSAMLADAEGNIESLRAAVEAIFVRLLKIEADIASQSEILSEYMESSKVEVQQPLPSSSGDPTSGLHYELEPGAIGSNDDIENLAN